MLEILDSIIEYVWVADFAALCLFAALGLRQKTISSSLLTQAVVVCLTGVIIQFQATVNTFVAPEGSDTVFWLWCAGFVIFDCLAALITIKTFHQLKDAAKPVPLKFLQFVILVFLLSFVYLQYQTLWGEQALPSYKIWKLACFYIGLVFFNALVIFAIRKAHDICGKQQRLLARTCTLAFFAAANLQLVMFLEVYLFETKNFTPIYDWGFASINMCTSGVALIIATLSSYQYLRKTAYKGPLWQL